ncbi:TPA: molecular chaperone [Serratia fonticola]|nr:molecular chaperone [Serratia fonticola]
MIKFFLSLFIFLIAINSCVAGVSVVGTRFFIDDSTKSMNIKVVNDNDSDYLIKTTINNSGFIISPPIFILHKNQSNIITIIPDDKNGTDNKQDEVYKLTIATIPRSAVASNKNVVSLAVRSHFNIIYRHKLPTDKDFDGIKLTRSQVGEWLLLNTTNFSFIISLSKDYTENAVNKKLFLPAQKIPVNEYCSENNCSLWMNILNEENRIVKKLNLISD